MLVMPLVGAPIYPRMGREKAYQEKTEKGRGWSAGGGNLKTLSGEKKRTFKERGGLMDRSNGTGDAGPGQVGEKEDGKGGG